MIILELQSYADRRGASYTTMITGYSVSCSRDGQASCPSVYGIRTAMRHALKSADLGPRDIDLIIAHGDGTVAGDRNEAEAIQQVFEGDTGRPPVYSSKAALGNLLAGAAAVDIILGSCMIERGIVPPVAGSYSPDSSLHVAVHVALNAAAVKDRHVSPGPRRIMINALSYEGQCSTIIIEAAR
jgi:3-oxoacyl-(acyl-carrier-protein) synthase